MKVNEAIQIIKVLGYIAEHDGTVDQAVADDAVRVAVTAMKVIGSNNAGRLTKWEGEDADGPRAVLVNRDGPFAPLMQEVLRKLAKIEDIADDLNKEVDDEQI